MIPRRKGIIEEYQNGHYFMYVTKWDAQEDGAGRQHKEIEIYYAKARVIRNSEDPIWNSTDPNMFDKALEQFKKDPESFEGSNIYYLGNKNEN